MTAPDIYGDKRLGLSVMSFHCRLAQIGRNKSKVYHSPRSTPPGRFPDAEIPNAGASNTFNDDDMGF